MKQTSIVFLFVLANHFLFAQNTDSIAQKLVAQMTLKEKVAEMSGRGINAYGVSMLITQQVKPVKAGGIKRLGIPATTFFDGPRGVAVQKGATAFPTTICRGASWDIDLERRIGEAIGVEIRSLDGNYSGAVCMNLLRHPAWGRAQETYGEDPHHLGEMATALVHGIQSKNVQACGKHFAANSMENNRFGGNITMDERTLHEVYLPHFKKVVKAGVASIMSAYNKVNGEYCGHNKVLLQDILRTDWGFRGYVTSDWQEGVFDAKKGINAGMNIEMPSPIAYKLSKIKKGLTSGDISVERIDKLTTQIIRTKLNFLAPKDSQYTKEKVGCLAHRDLAREAAEKCAVLLKNDNQLLPLDFSKLNSIAVLGSLADKKQTGDLGSSAVRPAYIVSPLEGIKKLANEKFEVFTAKQNDTIKQNEICSKADVVVIVAGTTFEDEGEYMGFGKLREKSNPDKKSLLVKMGVVGLGGDRKTLKLHQQDIDLIKRASSLNKNVIVCMVAGAAIMVEDWHSRTAAIIQHFYNGMEGGNALANLLFGNVNPSGKLPFTVPQNENDLPIFNSFDTVVNYGYYHGYTHFDKQHFPVRYPFGFGLSYSSFDIAPQAIHNKEYTTNDSISISVKIANLSAFKGGEVIQVYVGFPQEEVEMPYKLLRAFQKIYLDANEKREIKFLIPISTFSYFDTISKTWKVPKGNYKLFIGNSSKDAEKNVIDFEVK
jgi:beta-glucosidase